MADPRPLTLGQVVENIPQLVDLASLHERQVAKGLADGFVQRLRAIEDDQEAAVGAQSATLQDSSQALTDSGVFRGPFPHPQGVFAAVRRDAERHDDAVLPDVDAVQQQRDRVEAVQQGGLPGFQLRPWSSSRSAGSRALLLVPRLVMSAASGSRLRAYWRVATPTSICSTTRRSNGSVWAIVSNVGNATSPAALRTRGRWIATLRPPSTISLGTVPARPIDRTD